MGIIQTGMMAGGNIEPIINIIFSADKKTNPAKELNMLEDFLEDAVTECQFLEREASLASSELYSSERLESEVRNDLQICMNIIETLEVMIKNRKEV